ncbi:LysE family translocator [Paralimibaculum aggregatum]|uniref:LysE family translocator n=1 Tax=Paralimibaculum aggregatum TaxID=3036245 RepID=A0ABQ6LU13_9RHOB|nr:LysE family translocator [Limibaculum sp. NKW23]GMG85536.1 LysE family translocator [Limibaculum sp. NKW23]
MIDPATLLAYLAILTGFVFLPGPATLLTLARAAGSGTRAGMTTALGIAVGDLVHTVFAVVGISAVVLASATLFAVVKYLGAAYLVYLGIRAFRERAGAALPGAAGGLAPGRAFRQAVLAEVLNPKSALFFLAFLPQFVDPAAGAVALQLLVLGMLFVAMGLVSTLAVALSAGGIGGLLRRNPAVLRWQGRVAGAIFCGLGLRLAFEER